MGIFRQFPYSNFHEMNMDEILKIIREMLDTWARYYATWETWVNGVNEALAEFREWFDNLDVQDEINNKIDDMIESGEFLEIFAEYMPFVTPECYGAKGDGITNDTEAVQDAIDSGKSVYFSQNYLIDAITIENKSNVLYKMVKGKIIANGDGTQFRYSGTLNNVIFDGFKADGTNTTDGAFLFGTSGANLSNIKVKNCTIENYTTGVSFNADLAGSIKNVGVENCTFKNIKGTESGFGYGVHFASQTGEAVGGYVENCYFDNCHRHAVYVARGNGYKIVNNTFKNHKSTTSDGSISACVNVARSWNVIVANNQFYNNYSGCIRVSSELTNIDPVHPLPAYKANNILICNNIMSEVDTYAIIVGWLDADGGLVGSCRIIDNICIGALYIGCCEFLIAKGNSFTGKELTSQKEAIAIINRRDTNPYNSKIIIQDNLLNTTTATRCVRTTTSAKDDEMYFINNINLTPYALINAQAPLTNVLSLGNNDGLVGATYQTYQINGVTIQ